MICCFQESIITEFCTSLTGITSETVARGRSLVEAMAEVEAYVPRPSHVTLALRWWVGNLIKPRQSRLWCRRYVAKVGGHECCTLVAHGTWDLTLQLRAECARKKIVLSPWWLRFYDLREVFRWYIRSTQQSTSLISMCRHLGIQLSGRLHSGIDDATTIATVMRSCVGILTTQGTASRGAFPRPFDYPVEVETFRHVQGTVVRLESLPYEASTTDITKWLDKNGAHTDPPPQISRVV